MESLVSASSGERAFHFWAILYPWRVFLLIQERRGSLEITNFEITNIAIPLSSP